MIYFLHDASNSQIKIGTSKNRETLDRRIKQLRTANPSIEILGTQSGDRFEESRIHRNFQNIRRSGEWFHLEPGNPLALYLDRTFGQTKTADRL